MNQWSCANCLRWSSCTYQSIDKLVHPSGSSRSHNLVEFWRFPLSIDGPVCAARWKKIIHHVSYYVIASKATLPVQAKGTASRVTNRDQKQTTSKQQIRPWPKRDQPWPKSLRDQTWPTVTKNYISQILFTRVSYQAGVTKRDQDFVNLLFSCVTETWPIVTNCDQTWPNQPPRQTWLTVTKNKSIYQAQTLQTR